MRIAVVDDFQKDRDGLALWIEEYIKEKKVNGELFGYPGGEEFLKDFSSGRFQVVFLDIYMNGMNGMETAKRIRMLDSECIIIFSTSSEKYAVQGYSVRATDYLVKPYEKERVWILMDRILAQLSSHERYIEVKEEREMRKVWIHTIRMAELSGHYVWIYTTERDIKSRMKIKELLGLLDDRRFLECYRNVIVNMDYIEKLDGSEFLISGGKRAPIQENRLKAVRQTFFDYVFEKTQKGLG